MDDREFEGGCNLCLFDIYRFVFVMVLVKFVCVCCGYLYYKM